MKVETLDGKTKAAILLASLGHGESAHILGRLSPIEADVLSGEMSKIVGVSMEVRRDVLEEFCRAATVRGGGPSGAEPSLPPDSTAAHTENEDEREGLGEETEFQSMKETNPERILGLLQSEHPQVGALVLSYLPPAIAALVLVSLPAEERLEIVTRMTTLDRVSPEILAEVESAMKAELIELTRSARPEIDGVKRVARVLRYVDRATESKVMAGLEATDPELASRIQDAGFAFDDIVLLDGRGIRQVLSTVDSRDLIIALSVSTDTVRETIYRNMSAQEAQLVRGTVERMGPLRVRDVQGARARIVEVIKRLEDSGEIIIPEHDPETDTGTPPHEP